MGSLCIIGAIIFQLPTSRPLGSLTAALHTLLHKIENARVVVVVEIAAFSPATKTFATTCLCLFLPVLECRWHSTEDSHSASNPGQTCGILLQSKSQKDALCGISRFFRALEPCLMKMLGILFFHDNKEAAGGEQKQRDSPLLLLIFEMHFQRYLS